jgi:uncharacterized protein (TIRG00374 family)
MVSSAPRSPQNTAGTESRRTKWLWRSARIAGTILLFTLLFTLVPSNSIWQNVRKIPPSAFAVMVVLFVSIHLVGALKWQLLVNLDARLLTTSTSVRCYFAGLFSNTMLPSIVGGDAVTMAVGLAHSSSKLPVVFGTVINRMLDFGVLILLVTTGIVLLPAEVAPQARLLYKTISLIIGAVVLAAVVGLASARFVRVPLRWQKYLTPLRESVDAFLNRPLRVLTAFTIGVGMQMSLVGIGVWIGAICGLQLSVGLWLFGWPLAKLAALLPVSLGGLGAREIAFAGLLTPFFVEPALAVSVCLAYNCVALAGRLLAGLIALLVGRRGRKRAALESSTP